MASFCLSHTRSSESQRCFHTSVASGAESPAASPATIIERRFIYWVLCLFLKQNELEHGLKIQNGVKEWIRKKVPPFDVVKSLGRAMMGEICKYVD